MKLNAGDTVAIVAPASQLPSKDRELLPHAVDLLESWGLRVRLALDQGHWFYLAGGDAERARHVNEVMADPTVRAVFSMRGGYGSARILRWLTGMPTAKIIVGYSDITALHAYMMTNHANVALIHGPNVATHQLLDSNDDAAKNRESLHAVLFDSDYGLTEQIESLQGGSATGAIYGGCLTLLTSLLGTPYMPSLAGKLLFLEDGGEAPYRIDRLLTQLRDAGALDNVLGIVFGRMHNCTDPYNDIRDVIVDVIGSLSVPVGFGLSSGHGSLNLSLPLGERAYLDSDAGVLRVGASVPTSTHRNSREEPTG